jgi:hypothetical protein
MRYAAAHGNQPGGTTFARGWLEGPTIHALWVNPFLRSNAFKLTLT